MKFLKILFLFAIGFSVFVIYSLYMEYRDNKDKITSVLSGQLSLSSKPISSSSKKNYKYSYFQNDKKDINIVVFDSLPVFFYDKDIRKSAETISIENNFELSINGSYFTGSKDHAGLLIEDGNLEYAFAPSDKQLTGVVVLDSKEKKMQFFDAKSFNYKSYLGRPEITVFQTGPLLIKNNLVNLSDIKVSTNGNGKYYRSCLGYTSKGKLFFCATTSTYTLEDFSKELLKLTYFQGAEINVINLDGGTSTYIYSSENPDFSFDSFKILPIILGVKKDI